MQLGTTTPLAVQLERRVTRVNRLLRSHSRTSSSVAALLTLRRLDEDGPMRITDLASAELVAQPTMTGIVRRLEDDGLVLRSPDPHDARAVRVTLTDAGREELASVRASRAAVLQDRLDRLGEHELAALAAALPALEHLLSDS
jgi:DNA-binding MarR family transcriptional regulator